MRLSINQNRLTINQNRFALGGWSPDGIAYMWHDASDASAVTLNGSDVSQLDGKGLWGVDIAQAVAAQQPLYTDTVNGLNVMTFDYTASQYLTKAGLNNDYSNSAFIVMFIPIASGSVNASISAVQAGGNDWQMRAKNTPWLGQLYGGYNNGYLDTVQSNNELQMLSFTSNTVSKEIRLYKDGAFVATPETNFTGWDGTDYEFKIAVNRGGASSLSCKFCESMFVPLDQIENAHNYLKTKWGL